MPWVYRDSWLGYYIVKHAAFAHHVRTYDRYTESVMYELQQGFPFTLPDAWERIEIRDTRTFGLYKEQLYDITEVYSQPPDSHSPQ